MDICLHRTLLTLAMMVTSVPADHPTEPRPRLCHAAGDPRRRLDRFSGDSGANYSCLLLSSDGQRLYVGGRDQILSLHTLTFSNTMVVDQIDWRATDAKIQECGSKGKSKQRDCFNFIVAVLPVNESCLYACGTYAYSPTCTYIDTRTFLLRTAVDGQPLTEDGKGRVPFDPALRFTAAMVEGALYSGTSGNFLGTQHVISRSLGHQVPLKTETSLSWLQDPSFVASTFVPEPDGDKVYFFFTETRSRSEFPQRMRVTLVARVCKDDVGGERVLQKRWTTFLKAQMLCYLPEDKFPLTVLQDMYVTKDEDGTIMHGVFTSQWFHGSSHSSAVCAFTLADIQAVFEGKYKMLNRELQVWTTYTGDIPEPRPGVCHMGRAPDSTLNLAKELFLMDGEVHPHGHRPQLTTRRHNYLKIVVDSVAAVNSRTHRVMFLVTDRGLLHKALNVNNVSHIIEQIQLFSSPQRIQSLVLSSAQGVLYVASAAMVLRVPVCNCSVYQSCGQCVLARDPYCAWDTRVLACRETRGQPDRQHWLQDVERADACTVCANPQPRTRMVALSDPPEGAAALVEVSVGAGTWVSLPCPVESRLAGRSWTLDGTETETETAGELGHTGSLGFAATVQHGGLWRCWATENDYRTLAASYRLRVSGGAGSCPGVAACSAPLAAVSSLLAVLLLVAGGLAAHRCLRSRARVGQDSAARSEAAGGAQGQPDTEQLNKSPGGQEGRDRELTSLPAAWSGPRDTEPSAGADV